MTDHEAPARAGDVLDAVGALARMITDMIDMAAGPYQERYNVLTFADAWDALVAKAREVNAALAGGRGASEAGTEAADGEA